MIAIIVAMSENRVIGREEKYRGICRRIEKISNADHGNAIVMGRRTYDEIGHPLPGRMTYLCPERKRLNWKTATRCKV